MPRLQRYAFLLSLALLSFAAPSSAANATFKIIDVRYAASNPSSASHLVEVNMLPVAKFAVLIGSAVAGIAGLLIGRRVLARDTGANLQPAEGVDG